MRAPTHFRSTKTPWITGGLVCLCGFLLSVNTLGGHASVAPPDLASPVQVTPESRVTQTLKLDHRWPAILVRSTLQVGNKGEESLDVQVPLECGKPIWVFDHAEIHIENNRFGAAQFVGLPQPGCTNTCSPIVVRWYHEPTGHLAFGVKVYQRQTTLACKDIDTHMEVES